MSRNDKMEFIRLIEGSGLCISEALAKYDVPRSTYYRWKRRLRTQSREGRTARPRCGDIEKKIKFVFASFVVK